MNRLIAGLRGYSRSGFGSAVGFAPGRVSVHPIHGSQVESMATFARRVRAHMTSMAGTGRLAADHPAVRDANAAIDAAEARIGPDVVALSSHLLPLFVAAASRTAP